MADEKVLDPRFHLPPGVKDISYLSEEEFGEAEYISADVITESELYGGDSDYEDYVDGDDGSMYPPDYMEVVSQSVRTLPGGGQVVDVTVELPDLEDGNVYEVRITT